ncbi:MAG: site-specific integrase [Deltaproteobacteria bacterium]|nr:site-specific integrase [Deltaproteobacteria bacterium]MBW2027002.1 site-specific integrase [Deltaproteobacteria bacterium]
MPSKKRNKTKYPGVYWIEGTGPNGKPERIYYIMYRKNGKLIEEKAGRQFQDDMTPARAARLRAERMEGKDLSNRARRELERKRKAEEANKWTIDRLWEEYKRQKQVKGLGPDENRYKNYLREPFGQKEPKDIVPLDIDRMRIKMQKAGKAPQTIKLTLSLLRRIINFGTKKNLCKPLPFTIEMPKVNNQKTEDLSPDQLQRLLQAIEEDPHPQAGKIMLMALYTGMRRGELFRLKWQDIDFERGFIHIRNPKGGVDQTIPLNNAAREVLESIHRTDTPGRTSSPYVFPGRDGGQRTDIHHQVNRIKERAGLPKDFRALHGLRHVYASMLASSGKVDMYTLQKLLTHKSPQMTQRYAHLRDEALKKASNVAAEIINGVIKHKPEKVISITDTN